MSLSDDFIRTLRRIDPGEMEEMLRAKARPRGFLAIELRNDVRPVDLYCYLGARFGPPNGIQNFLRRDDSDNLIHWEWTLGHPAGVVSFQGMNFRTEVWISGSPSIELSDRDQLVDQLKADFPAHGKAMGKIRHHMEDWTEFVNPHQRIQRSVERLLKELDDLKLDPSVDRIDDHWAGFEDEDLERRWNEASTRYARGFSICFAIRSMLPVLAESYINLLMFLLLRDELKKDDRLRENATRQPIDVRIKLLSVNCNGFARQPDYSADACRKYHSLVNERNDLLHGNLVVDKLKFNDVYFLGRVPVFREYRSMWQRSLDIEMQAVGLLNVRDELRVVEDLIVYLESCLDPSIRDHIRQAASSYQLGWNKATGRLGVLFPEQLADMRLGLTAKDDPQASPSDELHA